MPDGSHGLSLLAEIKTHADACGIGSAILDDHVALGLWGRPLSPGAPMERIYRVTSLIEARRIIDCQRRATH